MERNTRKALVLLSVHCARELFSGLELMPPFTVEDNDDDNEENQIVRRRQIMRITGYIERLIPGLTDKQFQMHFRINRTTFEMLLPIIDNIVKKPDDKGRPRIETKRQLLAVIWLLATPDSYRSVGERFNLGKSSLSKAFFRIITALNKIAPRLIAWPQDLRRIKQTFYNKAGIDDIIGAVDGTFIPIKAPKADPESYITRKCHHAITLQAICDTSLQYIDIFVGYPGSVSDNRIFRNSDIYNRVNNNPHEYFPNQEFIIGDKAYPVLSWCVPPYIDRGNLTPAQRNFNLRIAQTRQVIERSFALLFGRFRRLRYLDMNRLDFIPATVLAACVLHNICLQNGDLDIDQYIEEGRVHVHGNDENIEIINHFIEHSRRDGPTKRDNICRRLFSVEE